MIFDPPKSPLAKGDPKGPGPLDTRKVGGGGIGELPGDNVLGSLFPSGPLARGHSCGKPSCATGAAPFAMGQLGRDEVTWVLPGDNVLGSLFPSGPLARGHSCGKPSCATGSCPFYDGAARSRWSDVGAPWRQRAGIAFPFGTADTWALLWQTFVCHGGLPLLRWGS
jgi:hypothetical protein